MLFHTLPFLLFMLVVVPGFYILRKSPLRIPWLLAASYIFYGWWNPYYLLLIVYSTALDYLLVALMDHSGARGGQGETWGGGEGGKGRRGDKGKGRDRVLALALWISLAMFALLVCAVAFGPP